MRWCIVNEDQENAESQGVWEEKCDDFGVPEESAEIERPQADHSGEAARNNP